MANATSADLANRAKESRTSSFRVFMCKGMNGFPKPLSTCWEAQTVAGGGEADKMGAAYDVRPPKASILTRPADIPPQVLGVGIPETAAFQR